VKEKKTLVKENKRRIVSLNFISRMKKVLSEESCRGVGAVLCYSLNYH
jgi:hypothetical protein